VSRTKSAEATTREERDQQVLDLTNRLLEIEQRLIPTGLHVLGRQPSAAVSNDVLRAIASFDRPDKNVRSLPDLITDGLGLPDYRTLVRDSADSAEASASRERVETLSRGTIDLLLAGARENRAAEAVDYLRRESCAVDEEDLRRIFAFLESILGKLNESLELDSLIRALRGEYIEPGPGADILQNPDVLPTGRNTHAVNPYAVPSPAAFLRAEALASALLNRHLIESGRYPETIAMVLWGIDNIKSEGEAVSQALWLLGVRPQRDSLNRVTRVEVVPPDRLGRPRIDVVMTVSGIFRDLFGTTMSVLDSAVRAVAALDEPDEQNFIAKHVRAEMTQSGCAFDDAVVRVFSNAAGNYGTNVNFMVAGSEWENTKDLGDLFVTRKCFAYGRDSRGRSFDGRESRRLLDRALERVEVTYQNIDSVEVGIVDVDHYFEYLGGVTRAVENRTGNRPIVYLSDTLSPDRKVRTLEETVELETRTKTLNPKWFEGMLSHGFSGVAEIEHRVTNTFGWSATADAVEDWIYDEVAGTFVMDEQMLNRLRELNPHSARTLVGRLLEASGRGFWSADQATLHRLRAVYNDLEDRLEGVS